MKRAGAVAVVLSSIVWLVPQSTILAAGPNRPAAGREVAAVHDVALGANGELRGQVVDAQGRGLAGRVVSVRSADRQVLEATTDEAGRYAAPQLRGGIYHVHAAGKVTICRCWANGTAPPAATDQVLLVDDSAVQRGQGHFEDLIFADPVLIGLFIAAAIAIPVAIHQSRQDSHPAS